MWGRSCQPCGIPKEGGHASDTKSRPALAWLRRNSPGSLPRRGWHPLRLWPRPGSSSLHTNPTGETVEVSMGTGMEGLGVRRTVRHRAAPANKSSWLQVPQRRKETEGEGAREGGRNRREAQHRLQGSGGRREAGREGQWGRRHSTNRKRTVPEKETRPRGRAGKNGHSKSMDVMGLRVQGECWTGCPAVRGTRDPSGTGSCDTTAQNQAESRKQPAGAPLAWAVNLPAWKT